MKIALIGYMGSGKSFWMNEIARATHLEPIDLDRFLEDEFLGMPIARYVETKGELSFRKFENQALNQLINLDNIVLATGGGTPCYYNNMDLLNGYFSTVFLDVSIKLLVQRLENEFESRPLIRHLEKSDLAEFIAKHLFERRPFYFRAHTRLRDQDITLDQFINLVQQNLNQK